MDENNTTEEFIDLNEIKQAVRDNKFRLLTLIVATTLFAGIIAFSLPKQYESTVLVRAKSQKPGSGISMQASAALALLGGATASSNQTYIEMIKSRRVLEPVIAQLDLPDKEKIQVKDFVKNFLKITNTKGTELIEIAATGRSPEEAQQISTAVIGSFQQELTRLNQSEQSLMVKFLKDRITLAKQDMEQAERDMEKFRQQEKIFVPDEQAKESVKKLVEFDKKIAQIRVENEANQTKLQGVRTQLARQNEALLAYNLSDNVEIQQIRSKIVEKQVQMVNMAQRFTDKHPGVILLNQELDELNSKLKQAIGNSVKAGTNTLNPVHGGLLLDKVKTELEVSVGEATVDELLRVQKENEQEISKLSANSLTYIGLERHVKIAQEVYTVLVRNYEQNRIQEAMESMDIQIVDAPNLPKRHSGPKRVLITAVGGVLGVMFAIVYLGVLFFRKKAASN
jgi:uncharacterized protein involved in exopolysaccharide biosynthesis